MAAKQSPPVTSPEDRTDRCVYLSVVVIITIMIIIVVSIILIVQQTEQFMKGAQVFPRARVGT